MINEFYCGSCGNNRPNSLKVKRKSMSDVCSNCAEKMTENRNKDLKQPRKSLDTKASAEIKKRSDDLCFQRELDKINKSLELECDYD
jgi:hypothetical protein